MTGAADNNRLRVTLRIVNADESWQPWSEPQVYSLCLGLFFRFDNHSANWKIEESAGWKPVSQERFSAKAKAMVIDRRQLLHAESPQKSGRDTNDGRYSERAPIQARQPEQITSATGPALRRAGEAGASKQNRATLTLATRYGRTAEKRFGASSLQALGINTPRVG